MVYTLSVTMSSKWNRKSLHTRYRALRSLRYFSLREATGDTRKRGSNAVTKRSCRMRPCAKGSALWPPRCHVMARKCTSQARSRWVVWSVSSSGGGLFGRPATRKSPGRS